MRLTKLSDDGMVVWTDEALYHGKIDREKIINRLYELEEEKELNKPPVTVSLSCELTREILRELPRETVERVFFGEDK